MQIYVARAGKELGTFSQEEVRNRLASGELRPTDHGWTEGQGDWILLSAFPGVIPPAPQPPPPAPAPLPLPPPPEPMPIAPLPSKRPVSKRAPKAVAEPVAEPFFQPAVEPVVEPVAESIVEPVSQPVAEPVVERVVEPVDEPTAEPAAKPVDEAAEETIVRLSLRRLPEPVAEEPIVRTATAATTAPVPRVTRPRPAPVDGDAIWSLFLGLLSISILPVLCPIPAIIFARSAQARIKRSGGALRGHAIAQVGLVTGYIGAALSVIALLAAIGWAVMGNIQAKSAQATALRHGEAIAMACRAYATDHKGAFPATLEALFPDYVADRAVFTSPLSDPVEPIGFEYYRGKESDPGSNVLLVSKGRSRGKSRVVVSADGTARVVRGMRELPPH